MPQDLLRSHAVELGGQTPCPARAQPGGQAQRGGGDDHRRAGVGRADLQMQPVIARAAGRRAARRWPRRPVGRRDRKGPCCFRAAAGRCAPLPSSSRSHRPAGSPWVTCTQNGVAAPARPTMAGGSDRAQWSRSCAAKRGGALALGRGGHAERVEHRDQRGSATVACLPVQSSYSVATPYRRASSTSEAGSSVMPPILTRCQSTSRSNKSSQVSRRTTSRAFPLRTKTTGTRRAPLYWLDIV